jgi:two-component system, chemotaxis family, protein-glutamate methylesterase/glutaminase
MPIKVLIVDDSALIRKLLTEIIGCQSDMQVVGCAPDPYVARDLIKQLNPDVLTLDVEMPKMDGLEFLERLMRLRPMPVIMISSLTENGSEITFRALELGAIDFVTKPKLGIADGLQEYTDEITEKIRAAAQARIHRRPAAPVEPRYDAGAVLPLLKSHFTTTEKVICIGASTGGTEALREVLQRMPADAPGIVVTQHMPPGFTRSFADRLNRLCAMQVKEAEGGERVLPGHVFIAPGDAHLLLKRSGANYMTELSDAPPVNRHRPAVDVLFRSAANSAGANALAVILTGMGKDGAQGMLEMQRGGSYTIAQDEASCAVYGMPREAVELGAVDTVLPLSQIAGHLLAKLRQGGSAIRV